MVLAHLGERRGGAGEGSGEVGRGRGEGSEGRRGRGGDGEVTGKYFQLIQCKLHTQPHTYVHRYISSTSIPYIYIHMA